MTDRGCDRGYAVEVLEEAFSETQEGTRAKEEGRGFYAPAPYLSPLAQAIA